MAIPWELLFFNVLLSIAILDCQRVRAIVAERGNCTYGFLFLLTHLLGMWFDCLYWQIYWQFTDTSAGTSSDSVH